MAWEWRTYSGDDVVIMEPCRLRQVVVTFPTAVTTPTNLYHGVTSDGPLALSLTSGYAVTLNVELAEPMEFPAGMYVALATTEVVVTMLIERIGHQ